MIHYGYISEIDSSVGYHHTLSVQRKEIERYSGKIHIIVGNDTSRYNRFSVIGLYNLCRYNDHIVVYSIHSLLHCVNDLIASLMPLREKKITLHCIAEKIHGYIDDIAMSLALLLSVHEYQLSLVCRTRPCYTFDISFYERRCLAVTNYGCLCERVALYLKDGSPVCGIHK